MCRPQTRPGSHTTISSNKTVPLAEPHFSEDTEPQEVTSAGHAAHRWGAGLLSSVPSPEPQIAPGLPDDTQRLRASDKDLRASSLFGGGGDHSTSWGEEGQGSPAGGLGSRRPHGQLLVPRACWEEDVHPRGEELSFPPFLAYPVGGLPLKPQADSQVQKPSVPRGCGQGCQAGPSCVCIKPLHQHSAASLLSLRYVLLSASNSPYSKKRVIKTQENFAPNVSPEESALQCRRQGDLDSFLPTRSLPLATRPRPASSDTCGPSGDTSLCI